MLADAATIGRGSLFPDFTNHCRTHGSRTSVATLIVLFRFFQFSNSTALTAFAASASRFASASAAALASAARRLASSALSRHSSTDGGGFRSVAVDIVALRGSLSCAHCIVRNQTAVTRGAAAS